MYFTRTSPMIRDRNVETIRMIVAENAECACEGLSSRSILTHQAEDPLEASVGVAPVTPLIL